MSELITQLTDRLCYSPAIEGDASCVRTDEVGNVLPPQKPNAPIKLEDVIYVESQIGFKLPPIIRQISTEVADGGFGPDWGINRLKHPLNLPFGPHWEIKMSVESWHKLYHTSNDDNQLATFPNHFIRYCEVGCNISICVDCTSESGYLFLDDPNASDPIQPMGVTLEEWLLQWLSSNPWPKQMYS
ncbi:SMI1/KNR4 family protein [Gimesia aquarii]|nr:SMI1/KNR4 family protein [Gimesia aquarii]